MRRFRGWSLRARLTALLLATLIPLAGVGGYWVAWEAQDKRAHAEEDVRQVAQHIATDAGRLVAIVHEMLAVLARLPAVQRSEVREAERLFRDLLAHSPHLENLGLIEPTGQVVASAAPLPPGPSASFLDKEWLSRVLRSAQPAVGGFYVGRITGKPVAHVAHPVLDGAARVSAVVFADLRLAEVRRAMTVVQAGAPRVWAVVDGHGLVLLHGDPGAAIGKPLGPLTGMLRAEAIVPGTDWRAIAGIPEAMVAARVRAELLEVLLPAGLILLIVSAVGFWIARNTWRPLQRLAGAVRRIGAGEPGVPIPVEAGGEVGEVATAFAQVLDTLTAREADLRRRHAEMAALLRATRTVMAGLGLQEMLGRIVREAAQIAGTSHAKVLLLDGDAQVLRLGAVAGRPLAMLEGFQLPLGTGLSGIVAASGQPLYVPECQHDPRNIYADQDRELGLVTYLGLPIMIRDEVVGVLTFNTTTPRQYTPEEMAFLTSFADQAAIAIENARLHETALRRAQQLATLNDLTRTLTTVLDPQAVGREILTAAQALVPGAAGRFFERMAEENAFRLVASIGVREPEGGLTLRFRLGEGFTGIAASTRQPVTSRDVTQDPRFINKAWAAAEGLVSCIVLPLVCGDRVNSSLAIFTRAPHDFAHEEVGLLQSFASQAAIALENARLYEAVRRHATDLEDRVRERTAELEKALRVKVQFLANMSHELRTPLNFILGFSQLLQQGTGGALTPKQAQFVDHIQKGGKWLLELVSNVLDLSLVEAGKRGLQLEPVLLAPLVQESLDLFSVQVAQKRLGLITELESGLPLIVADRRKLGQILYNLVGNAVKFTPDGGRITLTARKVTGDGGTGASEKRGTGEGLAPVPRFTDAPVRGERDYLELRVQDTGIGIQAQDLGRIFLPFEQVDSSDTRRYEGAGIGLALVRTLVELHGGRVWAASEGEGRGSTFTVLLPLLKPGTGTL